MLGSLLFSLSALSVSALPGFARKARQVDASVCPVPSTVTAYLPIITTIPEGQGNLGGINTIVSQGQPFVISSLSYSTASGTSGQVFGGTTVVNNGAAPANAVYTTFTSCTTDCVVAGATYTSGSVFYSTSTAIPALATTVIGGQTLQGTSGVLTTPTAVTSTFYSTIFNGVPVTDGSQPLSTTTVGANGVPTTIIQAASQVIATPAIGTLVQTLTQVTPGVLSPATTTIYITVTIDINGLPTTTTDASGRGAGAGPAGVVTLTPVAPIATNVAGTIPGAGTDGSLPTNSGAGTGPAIPNTPGSSVLPNGSLISVTTGADNLPTTVTIATGTGAVSRTATLPAISASGVTTGVDGLPTPIGGNNANTNLGTSPTLSGSQTGTASGSTSTATTISCTSDADCSTAGFGACLDLAGAPVLSGTLGVCGPLVSSSSNSAISSQTVPGGTATSAGSPSTTSISLIPCTSDQDCVNTGLAVCLDALGATIGTNAGLATGNCALVSPVQGSSSTSATSAPSTTAVSCSNSQQCTKLSLGVCLDILGNVVDLGLGSATGTCSGLIAPSLSQSLISLPTSLTLPLALPTGLPTTLPISLPASITVPAILPTVSPVVIAASDLLSSASKDAAGVSSLVSSLIDQATRTPTVSGILSLPTTISCANSEQCSELGLGLCATVPDLLTTKLGACALISAIGGSGVPSLSVTLDGSITLKVPSISIPALTDISISIPGVLPTISLPVPTDISVSVPVVLPTDISISIPNVLPTISIPAPSDISVSVPIVLPTDISISVPIVVPSVSIPVPTDISVSVPVVVPTLAVPIPTGASLSLPVTLPSITVGAPGTIPTSATVACNTDADCSSRDLGLCLGVDVLGLVGTKVCVDTGLLGLTGENTDTGAAATATAGIPGSGSSATNVQCQTNTDCSTQGLGVCAAVDIPGLAGLSICVDTSLLGNGAGSTGSLPSVSAAVSAGVVVGTLPASATISIALPTGFVSVNPPVIGEPTISAALPATTSSNFKCGSSSDCVAHGLTFCLGADLLSNTLGVCVQANADGTGPLISIGSGATVGPVSASVAVGAGTGAGSPTTITVLPGSTSAAAAGSCRSNADCLAQGQGLGFCLGLDLLDTASIGTCVQANADGTGPLISVGSGATVGPISATVAVGAGAGTPTTINVLPGSTSAAAAAAGSCRSNADCLAQGQGLGFCLGLNVLDTAVLGTCVQANADGTGPLISVGSGATVGPISATVAVGAGAGTPTTINVLPGSTSAAASAGSCRSNADCLAQGQGLGFCLGLNVLDTVVLGTCVQANADGTGPLISVNGGASVGPISATVAVAGAGVQATTFATIVKPVATTTAIAAPAVTSTAPANYGKACTVGLTLSCGAGSGLVCIPNALFSSAGTCLFST